MPDKSKTAAVAGGLTAGAVLALLLSKTAKAATPDELALIEEWLNNLAEQLPTSAQIESLTAALEAAGIEVTVPGEIREITIDQNVLPTQGIILTREPPFDGYIREVKIHWPPGCAGLVAVRVGIGTKQFCPFEGFLSLDNATPTYPFNEYVVHTEPLWVEIQNADAVNPHHITVMFNIQAEV